MKLARIEYEPSVRSENFTSLSYSDVVSLSNDFDQLKVLLPVVAVGSEAPETGSIFVFRTNLVSPALFKNSSVICRPVPSYSVSNPSTR